MLDSGAKTRQIGGRKEKEPSCAFATMFVLGALAQNPKLRNGEIAMELIFFLGAGRTEGR
ncbi:hypothetical protein IBX35_00150 [Candidatus Bathyarchaeota archaeon]|nr:hypothetical protein [Candidatus Bathyarchaeota archaeon]